MHSVLWQDEFMGLFKLQTPSAPSRLLLTRIIAWNARSPRLVSSDAMLVSEFRGKLRQTEELIGKLGFSLRELHRMHH